MIFNDFFVKQIIMPLHSGIQTRNSGIEMWWCI